MTKMILFDFSLIFLPSSASALPRFLLCFPLTLPVPGRGDDAVPIFFLCLTPFI